MPMLELELSMMLGLALGTCSNIWWHLLNSPRASTQEEAGKKQNPVLKTTMHIKMEARELDKKVDTW